MTPAPWRWSVAAWAGTSAAVALTIAATLLARVENIRDAPISIETPGERSRAIDLLETAGPAPPVYVLRLQMADSTDLLAYPEVRVLFSTRGRRVQLIDAALEVLGTGCQFKTPPGAGLADNQLVSFFRALDCPSAGAPTGELRLTVQLANRAAIAVWTFAGGPASARQPAAVIRIIGLPGYSGPPLLLRGRYVAGSQAEAARRIALLNYLWQVDESAAWLWLTLSVSLACSLAGAALLLRTPRQSSAIMARVAAMTLLAGGIAMSYAVVTPPFEAADEPDHFLSYARLMQSPSLAAQAADLARLGHLERIKFHRDERFRPDDVGRPFPLPWDDETFAEDVTARSTTTAWWWRVLWRLLPDGSVAGVVLGIRFANVLLFAVAVGLATALLMLTARDEVQQPELLSAVFLLVPTLPFFAMPVSEFAVLCGSYVVLAACVLCLFLDGRRSHWIGAPLGLVTALMAASGRSALPMLPLIGAALLARAALGDRNGVTPPSMQRPVAFWIGFSICFSAITLLLDPEYPQPVDNFPQIAQQTLLPAFRWLWDRPWTFGLLGLGGLGLELLTTQLRRRIGPPLRAGARTLAAGACVLGAAAIVASFFGSLWIRYPSLESLGVPPRISAAEYANQVLAVVFTTFRLSEPDLLLTTSFAAGFGWIDALPGNLFVTALVVGTGVALTGLLIWMSRRHDLRRTVWLVMIGAGWTLTVTLYAIATHGMSRNLHGRYLIGAYLSVLAVCLSSMSHARHEVFGRLRITLPAAVLITVALIHTYCLRVILVRYF